MYFCSNVTKPCIKEGWWEPTLQKTTYKSVFGRRHLDKVNGPATATRNSEYRSGKGAVGTNFHCENLYHSKPLCLTYLAYGFFFSALGNFHKEFVPNYIPPGSVAAGLRGFYSGSKIWSLYLGILFSEWQLAFGASSGGLWSQTQRYLPLKVPR